MLDALATVAEAAEFGVTTTDAALLRASTRVRAHVRQHVSLGSSTVTVRGPLVHLAERPVVSVDSVLDEDSVAVSEGDTASDSSGWWLSGNTLSLPTSATYTVTYSHGFEVIPDDVIEVVVTVAERLGGTDTTVAAGVVQEQSGSVSQTFGWDAWKGVAGLTAEEKARLARIFPRVPQTLVMRG